MTRDDGTPAQVGDTMRIDAQQRIHFDPPPNESILTRAQYEKLCPLGIDYGATPGRTFHFVMTPFGALPNRLAGVTINSEGDAV